MEKWTSASEKGCFEGGLLIFISFAIFATLGNVHLNLQIKEQVQERFKHLNITWGVWVWSLGSQNDFSKKSSIKQQKSHWGCSASSVAKLKKKKIYIWKMRCWGHYGFQAASHTPGGWGCETLCRYPSHWQQDGQGCSPEQQMGITEINWESSSQD